VSADLPQGGSKSEVRIDPDEFQNFASFSKGISLLLKFSWTFGHFSPRCMS